MQVGGREGKMDGRSFMIAGRTYIHTWANGGRKQGLAST